MNWAKKIQKLWSGLSPSWVNIFSSVEVSEVLLLLKLRPKIRKSDFGIFREWISVIQGCWLRFFIGISLREVWKSTPEEFQFLSRFFSRNFNMSFESGFHRFLILCFISEEDRSKVWNFNQHPGRICLIWFRIVWIGWKWRPDSCFGTLRQSLAPEQWNLTVSEPSNNSWKNNQEVWFDPGIPP